MSVWNPDNIKDVAESVGISSLSEEVVRGLSSDIEYRLAQVLEEALKFMRHSKRTTLWTQDIAQALRTLDVEPLYGYESTRPLRFGEASIGPGQPLFYVEDEEVDFEKLINAPLPKVPREISLTAHWLAVEGVQPSIPQNPTTADSRNQELVPKGPGANPNLAAIGGNENVTVKPLVKHILSKELNLYFGKVSSTVLDESKEEDCVAAFASVRSDPGLHQLVPYFVQFIAEKVTHNLKDSFILTQMMQLASAMLDNKSLYLDPYITSLIPPILTCLIGRHLGSSPAGLLSTFGLRQLAASIVGLIAKKYAKSSYTLRNRLARTCLQAFLDPMRPLGANYGGIIGLQSMGGAELARKLFVPNLKEYGDYLREAIEGDDEGKRKEAEIVLLALVDAIKPLEGDSIGMANGLSLGDAEEVKENLKDKIGSLVAERVLELGRPKLVKAILEEQDLI